MATSDPSSDDSMQNGGGRPAAEGRGAPAAVAQKQDFFGHPRGLSTLFFTELWERFSYYGMRALLVLYMTAAATGVANPGLGFDTGKAAAIYGLYTFFVYVLALPGGWVADNIWGQRRAVFVGGCIITAGHFSMALPMFGLPEAAFFYLGLTLIVVGTGFLKPNVSTMVGDLYPEGGARRDAGFSIFYMGINFGAILGPTLCGLIGEGYNWHWGFSLAGFGMLAGLISYQIGSGYLGDAGLLDVDDEETVARLRRNFHIAAAAAVGLVLLVGYLMNVGLLGLSLEQLAGSLGGLTVLIAVGFFVYIIFFGGHTTQEQKRLGVIFWLFILAALFWSGFEQAGSSLNLFARELTERTFGPYSLLEQTTSLLPVIILGIPVVYVCYRVFRRDDLWYVGKLGVGILSVLILGFVGWVSYQMTDGWTMPASMLQNINPFFIVVFAPLFGTMWTWLAEHNANPSIPVKFALGLFGLSAGFFVISWGAANATAQDPVTPAWLVVTYFLHTSGELCLSPVGLSSMTKLAPEDRVGQMMGIWFVAAALGNLFAGLIAGQLETLPPSSLFWTVALIVGGGGIVALLAAPPVKRLMGDVE